MQQGTYHPNRHSVASAKPAEHEGNMHSKETLVQKVFVLGYFVEIVSKKKNRMSLPSLSTLGQINILQSFLLIESQSYYYMFRQVVNIAFCSIFCLQLAVNKGCIYFCI